jgi:hypothetical protein
MAPLTRRLSFIAFSMYTERRCKMASRMPPASPAWIRLTNRLSKTLGCLRSESDSVRPPSTLALDLPQDLAEGLVLGLVDRMSRHCTMGRPASISGGEQPGENSTMSSVFTPDPKLEAELLGLLLDLDG